MKKNKIYFNVYGMKIRVLTDNSDLLNYVNNNLESFQIQEPNDFKVDLDVVIYFSELFNTNNLDDVQTPDIYWGSEFYMEAGLVCYKEKRMKVLAKQSDCFAINGAFDLRTDQKIRKTFGFSNMFLFNAYQKIYRYMVELPLIHLLQKKGFSPLHASAILTADGTCSLFVGLNGAGKSTYATRLAQNEGCVLLSDNFCLIKAGKVYPLPGLVKLHDNNLVCEELSFIGKAFGKSLYKHRKVDTTVGYRINTISMVSRRLNTKGDIKKIKLSKDEIFDRIIFVSKYLKEYPEYNYLSYFNTFRDSIESDNIFKLIDNANECIDLIL
jgi:hypothetical protein